MGATLPWNPLQVRWRFRLMLAYLLLRRLQRRRQGRRYARKRWWVRPVLDEEGRRQGEYQRLHQVMGISDRESFFEYYRMSVGVFDALLGLVGPSITKASLTREVISPGERLSVTLRYLAGGDSMGSLSTRYKIGKTTVSNIINETCDALWKVLRSRVFTLPSAENWRRISSSFWEKWNFPNCIGAIDGRHVVMQSPANSGTECPGDKGSRSLILFAACDADYVFTVVDVCAAGRQSDVGVFKNTLFGRYLKEGRLDVPPPAVLPGSRTSAPYVFVGDESFPLCDYLMRPFPAKDLDRQQRIFNCRLGRARRAIENALGIMIARFRVFRRPVLGKVENVERCVKAVVCLHNWIIQSEDAGNRMYCPAGYADGENERGELVPGEWRGEVDEKGWIRAIGRVGSNNYRREVYNIREVFVRYFTETGQPP